MPVHIARGDTVVLRRGKEKGKRGVVKAVFPRAGYALVEGVNVVKRHTKAGAGGSRQAGIFEKEGRVPISALMVVDPKSSAPTRVRRVNTAEGRVRVSVRSGEHLPSPGKGR